jgi:glycosyltransferase involved in cell wall biosynthesis
MPLGMKVPPLASVIVNNYNYDRFLGDAIDSALAQTYPGVEVIVVDDGSTDDSRQVIASYGSRIVPVLKDNGGQTSALNAGFAVSRGEIICFLDADDMLHPTAVQRAADLLLEEDVVKVHWPLLNIDVNGRQIGRSSSSADLADGDLREAAKQYGPLTGSSPPTSGNAWSRAFLEETLPLPEVEKELGVGGAAPDDLLSFLATLAGAVRKVGEPQAFYRLHGGNDYSAQTFEEKVRRSAHFIDHIHAEGEKYCRRHSIEADTDAWIRNSWFHKVSRAVGEMQLAIPIGELLVLADEAQWGTGTTLAGRRVLPFMERDGVYWGSPPNDAVAITELERLRASGAGYMAVTWPAFWLLECYPAFHRHLRSHFACLLENERLVIFQLLRAGT